MSKISESFKRCHRCRGKNTQWVHDYSDTFDLIYVGYCNDCDDDYSYRKPVSNVTDKKQRI